MLLAAPQIISERGVQKQLALQVLFDVAHNVARPRVAAELWRRGAVETYLSLLGEHNWHMHAVNAISNW